VNAVNDEAIRPQLVELVKLFKFIKFLKFKFLGAERRGTGCSNATAGAHLPPTPGATATAMAATTATAAGSPPGVAATPAGERVPGTPRQGRKGEGKTQVLPVWPQGVGCAPNPQGRGKVPGEPQSGARYLRGTSKTDAYGSV
jgi:hypothetical protein